MVDLLAQRGQFLAAMNDAYMASPVTITRPGSPATENVPAKRGKTPYETVGGNNVIIAAETRDFIITITNYTVSGAAVKPLAGDTITDEFGTWTVMNIPGGFCYRVVEDVQYRIHTKATP